MSDAKRLRNTARAGREPLGRSPAADLEMLADLKMPVSALSAAL
ncbi:MAG: hypothetical protein M0T79_05985 [Actinomycetota bacterium]|nr:hypothetical protein [Actinomycetota bacterium]